MTTTKLFSDLYDVEEFINYYQGAKRSELRARMTTLKKRNQSVTSVKNERKAIEALLA